jgi:hypothetical protein
VLKPVHDKARAMWVARALGHIDAPDLRIARPVRSTDGRSIIGGWTAGRFLPGTPEHRCDEVVLAAIRLHRATVDLPRPAFRDDRTDLDAVADRIAWEEMDVPLAETKGGRWFEVLAGARKPIPLPDQVVHGALLGNVLFDGQAAPGIVDFIPYYRPAEWGCGRRRGRRGYLGRRGHRAAAPLVTPAGVVAAAAAGHPLPACRQRSEPEVDPRRARRPACRRARSQRTRLDASEVALRGNPRPAVTSPLVGSRRQSM